MSKYFYSFSNLPKLPKFYIGISNKWLPNIASILKSHNQKKYNRIFIFPKKNETIYLVKITTLIKITNIPYSFFIFLTKKQKRNVFINVIKDNLQNSDNLKIVINNEEKTLSNWAEFVHKPKNHLIRYCYLYGIKAVKTYITNYIRNINNVSVYQSLSGNMLTINNITNNFNRWNKLCGFTNNHLYMLLYRGNKDMVIEAIKSSLSQAKETSNIYIEINNLYATCQQWAKFINKPKYYFNNMINKMGYNYTRNYLLQLINNKEFACINRNMITINNESHTLYGWAKRLNKHKSVFYTYHRLYGMEYTINFIIKNLTKQNKTVVKKLSEEFPVLKAYNRLVAVSNFSCRKKMLYK